MKKTAAIVVTYNRKDLLKESINSLMKQTCHDDMEIIIIDNASTDGTYDYISDLVESKAVIYKNTGANLGGAGGFQYGVKYAVINGYDFIWMMDDDSIPQPDALEQLLFWHEKLEGNYGFLASKVLWTDGSICNMNVQKTSINKKVEDFTTDKVKIIASTFVSMFFSTDIVKEIGLPIKEFFIWCDDLEYTRRISMKHPCYLINNSVVVHKCGSNSGSNIAIDNYERLPRYKYAYRNEMYFFRREGIKGRIYHVVRLILHIMRVVFKADNHKFERLSVIFKSTKEGINFNPQIEYIK